MAKFWKKHQAFWAVLWNYLFQIVFSLKKRFIMPLGINDRNGTESHCRFCKWRSKFFIYTHARHTSENCEPLHGQLLPTDPDWPRALWRAEPGFPEAAAWGQREHVSSETKPLAAPHNLSQSKCSLTRGDSLGEAWTLTQGYGQTGEKHRNQTPDHHLPSTAHMQTDSHMQYVYVVLSVNPLLVEGLRFCTWSSQLFTRPWHITSC